MELQHELEPIATIDHVVERIDVKQEKLAYSLQNPLDGQDKR